MDYSKINDILELADDMGLSFQEKVILGKRLFMKDGKNYLHNYGFREIIIAEKLNLTKIEGLHGKDTEEKELKTVTKTRRVDGKIHITKNTVIGELGRADKDNINDDQDLVCSIVDQDECFMVSFIIKNDDAYKSFREKMKNEKREQMKDFKNKRDTTPINYGDLINFNYDVVYHNDEELNIDLDDLD